MLGQSATERVHRESHRPHVPSLRFSQLLSRPRDPQRQAQKYKSSKVNIFNMGAPRRMIDKSSPDSMESVLKVMHQTSFFDETFNGVEVGFLAGLKALGVMQDQVNIILVTKPLVDIGYSWLIVRDVLSEGERISISNYSGRSFGSSHRVVDTEDFIN
jgi:hypothetical protein